MHRARLAGTGLAALFAPFALVACGGDDNQLAIPDDCEPVVEGVETAKDGKLSMAVAEYPPYVTNKSGELGGVDGDVLTEVALQLCLQPDVSTQSFTAVIESVKNGNADLSAGNWYINDERQEQFEVSDPVYADQMAVISNEALDSVDSLEGKTIGTTQGYLWVSDMQKTFGKNNVKLYATEDAVYQDLRAGRIDAGIVTYGGATQLLTTYKDEDRGLEVLQPDDRIKDSVGTPRTAVLIHKGNTSLLEAVNTVVASLREDGRLAEIIADNGLPESAAEVG